MSARSRLGLWLLRGKRVRFDATCPHGTFVPSHAPLDGRRRQYGCAHCDFHVRVAVVDDPYRSEVCTEVPAAASSSGRMYP